MEVDPSSDAQVGHVLYHGKDVVKSAASATHHSTIGGRVVSVESVASYNRHRKREAKGEQGRSLRVFVKGVPPVADVESLLRAHLADCGAIRKVTLARDKQSGQLKGVAYVEFSEQEGAEAALRKDGTQLAGHPRPIGVVRDQPPPLRPYLSKASTASAPSSALVQTAPTTAPARVAPPPKLGLVPRAVRGARPLTVPESKERAAAPSSEPTPAQPEAAEPPTNSTSSASTPALSNADFRAFLQRSSR